MGGSGHLHEPPGDPPGAGSATAGERASRSVFAALFLSTGVALVVYVLSGVSLPAALGGVLLGASVVGAVIWRRRSQADRVELRRSLRAGVIAGLAATGAYDLVRYLLVKVARFEFWPFDVFAIFGQALVGPRLEGWFLTAIGGLYHLANGIGFALGYAIWAGRRGVWAGIAWALVLETFMVTLYPGWLGLKALDEFLQISVIGHLAYGAVLGFTSKRLLLAGNVLAGNVPSRPA